MTNLKNLKALLRYRGRDKEFNIACLKDEDVEFVLESGKKSTKVKINPKPTKTKCEEEDTLAEMLYGYRDDEIVLVPSKKEGK